jgi:hypothetical protein
MFPACVVSDGRHAVVSVFSSMIGFAALSTRLTPVPHANDDDRFSFAIVKVSYEIG